MAALHPKLNWPDNFIRGTLNTKCHKNQASSFRDEVRR